MSCGHSFRSPFKTAAELYELLSGTQQVQVHAEVPRGPKSNACFVVDISVNAGRCAAGQRSVYWDDCGVWNSKDGHHVTSQFMHNGNVFSVVKVHDGKDGRHVTTQFMYNGNVFSVVKVHDGKDGRHVTTQFMYNGNVFSVVKVHDGKVCKWHRVDKKQVWVPLTVQPEMNAHVSMSGYCATLKVDAGYHKSVTWIVSQPTVGVYKYFDTCSDTVEMVCEDGEITVASAQCVAAAFGILAQQHFHLT